MDMNTIPVINIEQLGDPETLEALDEACRNWGFFQVTRHGIGTNVTTALFFAMRTFFSRPQVTKQEISRTEDNPWGFFDRELTGNKRDQKEIYDFGPTDGRARKPQWPRSIPWFEPAIRTFYTECERLSRRLLSAISCNLGMPRDYLGTDFGAHHSSFLRLNYYPLHSGNALNGRADIVEHHALGINPHTDAGALTLLLQDNKPGLEVLRDGHWHLVEPRPDALVVNVGDIMQVWSNDRYRASMHRVIASTGEERFSAPFFFNPAYATNYQPLPSTIAQDRPPRYRAINWGEFRALRAAGDFADHGEEVQINHYRK